MTYLWRDIDADLWTKVKTKAAAERLSVRELLVKLVTDWVSANHG